MCVCVDVCAMCECAVASHAREMARTRIAPIQRQTISRWWLESDRERVSNGNGNINKNDKRLSELYILFRIKLLLSAERRERKKWRNRKGIKCERILNWSTSFTRSHSHIESNSYGEQEMICFSCVIKSRTLTHLWSVLYNGKIKYVNDPNDFPLHRLLVNLPQNTQFKCSIGLDDDSELYSHLSGFNFLFRSKIERKSNLKIATQYFFFLAAVNICYSMFSWNDNACISWKQRREKNLAASTKKKQPSKWECNDASVHSFLSVLLCIIIFVSFSLRPSNFLTLIKLPFSIAIVYDKFYFNFQCIISFFCMFCYWSFTMFRAPSSVHQHTA